MRWPSSSEQRKQSKQEMHGVKKPLIEQNGVTVRMSIPLYAVFASPTPCPPENKRKGGMNARVLLRTSRGQKNRDSHRISSTEFEMISEHRVRLCIVPSSSPDAKPIHASAEGRKGSQQRSKWRGRRGATSVHLLLGLVVTRVDVSLGVASGDSNHCCDDRLHGLDR